MSTTSTKKDLETIRRALHTGQASATKVDAQRAFERLLAAPESFGPISGDPNNPGLPTPEAREAARLLMLLDETQRGLVLCWFCRACHRYVGPGDHCEHHE